jgi:hypothetical protein
MLPYRDTCANNVCGLWKCTNVFHLLLWHRLRIRRKRTNTTETYECVFVAEYVSVVFVRFRRIRTFPSHSYVSVVFVRFRRIRSLCHNNKWKTFVHFHKPRIQMYVVITSTNVIIYIQCYIFFKFELYRWLRDWMCLIFLLLCFFSTSVLM